MSSVGGILRTFDDLYELRRLQSFDEFIRGTVISTYSLKGGICRVLLEDDSASGLERSVITYSPFDSFSEKRRLFVTLASEVANLLSIPSRHVCTRVGLPRRTKSL